MMQITLGESVGDPSFRMDRLTRGGRVIHSIASNGFRAEIEESPELSLLHVARDHNQQPLALILVSGHLELQGELCDNDRSAERFFEIWEKSGIQVLNQLEGAFLIVIHEVSTGKTSLISDPYGSRPLWMAEQGNMIFMGSIPHQVALNARLPIEPDPAWLWSMIKFRRTVGERSSIRGVNGLPSGSVMTFEHGRCRTDTWFDFTFQPKSGRKAVQFGMDFLELTTSTVARNCKASEYTSLLLSGGLDSRLLAAVSPKQVHCLTLCDSVNREVLLAQRIAQVQNLKSDVIVRPEDWYPDLLQPSCQLGDGVWLWDQAHFLPLGEHGGVGDTALLGYGADTLFKGKDIDDPELWDLRVLKCGSDELVNAALTILERRTFKIKGADRVLNPDYAEVCRSEFMQESRRQLNDAVSTCTELPDLWQSFWSRNMARAGAFMNLVSLRGFTRERNVFTTVGMRRFYLTLPSELRRSGMLPLLALRAGGFKGLLSIPDANTWLPYTVPRGLHQASAAARRTIAVMRKKIRSRSRDTNYKSNCSWPHNGRLWLYSQKMTAFMEDLIHDDAFDASRFDPGFIGLAWEAHREGQGDFSALLDFLGTYGGVFGHTPTTLNRDIIA